MAFGQFHIDEMFAFVVVDDDGTEGVVGIPGSDGQSILAPMVGADMTRMEKLTPLATAIATATGKAIEVVKFVERVSVKTIKPGGPERKAPKLAEQVERVAPPQFRQEVQMFDQPVMLEAAQMHGVVVAPAIGPGGTPAVGLVFIDEQGKELPPVVVVGPTAKDIGPLCADAFQKAKQAIG